MKKLGVLLLSIAAGLFIGSVAQAAMDDEEGGDKKFSIHGEIRFRGEWWNNLTDFTDTDSVLDNSEANDSLDLFPYRVRLAAKGDLGHDIYVYGEFQGAGVAGGGTFGEVSPVFGDDLELIDGGVNLYQGTVKLKDVGTTVLDLTFGRQEIVFDRGLHFSSLDFYNGISHDGVLASWDWENFAIQGFWIRPFESNLSTTFIDTDNASDDDTYGAHFTHMIGKDHDQDVAYYLFLQAQDDPGLDDVDGGTPGSQRGDPGMIYTVGGRWGRMLKNETGFVWNAELALQFGDFQPCASGLTTPFNVITGTGGGVGPCVEDTFDQKSYVFEGSFGYMWNRDKRDQKVWAGLTLASGDDDPNDMDQESYVPLYTDFHNRLGYADLFAITNIQAISVGYKASFDDKHIFGAVLYNFTQAETESGTVSPLTFASTGNALADACFSGETTDGNGDTVDCNDDLGNELDLFYNYNVSSNFSFDTALSWFEPGDAIEDHWSDFGTDDAFPGGSDPAWRLTLQARARF